MNHIKELLNNIEKYIIILMLVLMIIAIGMAAGSRNNISTERMKKDYTRIENINIKKIENYNSSTETIYEHSFKLDNVDSSDVLAFYINHNDIEVYIDDECVYTLTGEKDSFKTNGGNWPIILLDREDSGKEVRVLMYPLYKNYQKKTVKFFVGNENEIYKTVILDTLPELVISSIMIFIGLLLLLLSASSYYRNSNVNIGKICAISVLAINAGLWRITYSSCIYLIFHKYSVMIYVVSIISLMLVSLALLSCIEDESNEKKIIKKILIAIYGLVFGGQIILQMIGIIDLRQILKITHSALIISVALIFYSSISMSVEKISVQSYLWIVGVGLIIDLFIYYFSRVSANMRCTLLALLIYVLIESVMVIKRIIEQKNALSEMELKLEMSRTTIMMSQIRSHFVFNLLNAISGMCKYDPEKADNTIVRFARYLRNNINIMEEDKNIPFKEDLRQLEDYVALEQIRFGDKIRFYEDIQYSDFEISPLILQPVVENAVKHGVSKKNR